ncbi:MAG: hypothetical protein GXP02_03130, partial [Alphaproteobacteria bacterium]|nr:hypothetical protein [Alphaproteobacteria bacterium]
LPPFKHRSLLSLLTSFERLGQRWWHNLAGVLIIEAEKQIYATGSKARQSVTGHEPVSRPAIVGNQFDSKNIRP